MPYRAVITLAIFALSVPRASAQVSGTFAATSGQVLRLVDVNGDGDFLDFAEVVSYANPPATLGSLAASSTELFAIAPSTATVYTLHDLNNDGDALDFAEVLQYAQLPTGAHSPIATGLALAADGTLYTLDSANNLLYRIHDANADGDALDFAEVLAIASAFTSPVAVTLRSDGSLLVTQNTSTIPVRILRDRNADGDFLDFAENISYAESFAPGANIVCMSPTLAYLARTSDASIVKLTDLTGDHDALDFAEVLTHATNLTGIAHLAIDANDALLAASQASVGSVYRVTDLNGDGDALDFAETLLVAQAGSPILGLATVSTITPVCRKGDVNFDTLVNMADIPLFSSIVIGATTPADPCPADVNDDGLIDGRDIRAFIVEILP